MKKSYSSTGIVLGNLWMGGRAGYRAERLKAKTKKALLKKAQTMLENGSLDSGMGFKGLIGALLDIKTTETIQVKGKDYSRTETELEFIGKLTAEQQDQMIEWLYQI